ncbi:MAG: putative zinc-binding metallopeptidase [Candidatus Eisenbacteria bacterium]|uniref:Zinc-binding metallopeptidase n=1 Tax=Eiseniibacteriota bacterium TaxID=2212470 RepID=A0A933W319_UNCEI|nr:putative zinc-binding metallopeptidase [Candidatus Eisenbacteria bacterium]
MAVRIRRTPRPAATSWQRLDDERLLDLRFRDLGLAEPGAFLQPHLEQVWDELAQRGLRLKPHVWLSTEWFSPDGVPGVAIPFYLAHPRLLRLEKKMMLEAEGGTREECLSILRHEFGHCMQHAWRLHRRAEWRRHFGNTHKPYPEIYRPNPASNRFVQHLRQYYAQAHPDEDFAETFAVWLTPRSAWRRRYAGWPALRKLEYVDELMRELRGAAPAVRSRMQVEPLAQVKRTLREHYAEKQAHYARWRPTVQDRDLQRLFAAEPGRRHEPAARFVKRNRGEIRRLVSRFTGESPFTLERVLDDVIARCLVLDLRASGNERRLRVDVALLLTVRTVHFHYSRKNWIAL